MNGKLLEILSEHRIAAIATIRSDGWPQATMIAYANDGLSLYFVISRQSQKFANLERDPRASLAVGQDYRDVVDIRGLSISADIMEVRDARPREKAFALLAARHPKLADFGVPAREMAALMRATPRIITITDFGQGFGHAEIVTISPDGMTEMQAARPDDWGLAPNAAREAEIQWRS